MGNLYVRASKKSDTTLEPPVKKPEVAKTVEFKSPEK